MGRPLAPLRRWRDLLRTCVLILVVAGAGLLVAGSPEPAGVPPLNAEYWLDESGTASAEVTEGVFEHGRGRVFEPGMRMPLGGARAMWIRLPLAHAGAPREAVLSIPYPGIDRVEVHRRVAGGTWSAQVAGDQLPAVDWPMRHLHPAFALSIQPGEPATLLRIQHGNPIALHWELQDATAFQAQEKLAHLLLGGLLGVVAIVVVVSLFNAYAWRDMVHVGYAVQVVLLGLSFCTLNGVGTEFLWPRHPWWADLAPLVVPLLTLAWLAWFVRAIVAERGDWLVESVLAGVAAGGVGFAAYLVAWGREGNVLGPLSLFMLAGLALLVAVMAWYARHHPQSGRWMVAGLAMLLLGSLFPLLRNLQFLSVSFATQNATQIAWLVEVPLMLVGLLYRSRSRRDSRLRLQSLTRVDPLTGVANHEQLCREIDALQARARHGVPLGAVVRVRIANVDAFRAHHGREGLESALFRAAACVSREAQPNDTVGRETGGDFVLVMQGQVSREDAIAAGRNIIARGLKFSRLLPPGTALSLRVAIAPGSLRAGSAGVLAALGQTLDELQTQSRPMQLVDLPDAPHAATLPVAVPPAPDSG